MKFAADALVITAGITPDHDLAVHQIPPANSGALPRCEVLQVGALPGDVMAYIDQSDRKYGENR